MTPGFRIWTSVLLLCIGSALLSWRQTTSLFGGRRYPPDYYSPAQDEWAPMPERGRRVERSRSASQLVRSEAEDRRGPTSDRRPAAAAARTNDGEEDEGGPRRGDDGATTAARSFREPKDGSIESISLLGERNSGTRWIYGHLGLCFNHTIPVLRSLSRYKHWFQYDDASRIPERTLSIAMFRDPMTWTWAMRAVPHHASAHVDLDWEEFVSKEWTARRTLKDEAWRDHHAKRDNNDTDGRICQENFRYREVSSCLTRPYPEGYWGPHRRHRFSQHQPLYEMRLDDPRGRPYGNILEMRADKIRNFLESAEYSNVEGFWHYRYEGLLETGTRDLVERIERATGVKRHPEKCKVYEPQNRRRREMDPEFVDYMTEHVDWGAEALIGYERPKRPDASS